MDGIDDVETSVATAVDDDVGLQLESRPGLNVFYVGLDNTAAPFGDERVRQAIAMGIDRKRIVERFFPVGSEVASHFTPCAIANGCAGAPWYEFDPLQAKEMLVAAGFPSGFDTKIHYRRRRDRTSPTRPRSRTTSRPSCSTTSGSGRSSSSSPRRPTSPP